MQTEEDLVISEPEIMTDPEQPAVIEVEPPPPSDFDEGDIERVAGSGVIIDCYEYWDP